MNLKQYSWFNEPIMWVGAVLAGLNAVYIALTGDLVDFQSLWESLIILGAALVGRQQVSPIVRS